MSQVLRQSNPALICREFGDLEPWSNGGVEQIRIAAYRTGVRTLGPGLRSTVWVQGCPFACAGCMSPGWAPFSGGRQVTPGDLLSLFFSGGEVQGLTISGGEPMLQAAGLARMVQQARRQRDLDVICYTGYRLEQLESAVQIRPGVADFLREIDVLIDGPYIQELNDNRGLRGSTNQRVHFLTDRLVRPDFEDGPRSLDLTIHDGYAFVVGIPPRGVLDRLRELI